MRWAESRGFWTLSGRSARRSLGHLLDRLEKGFDEVVVHVAGDTVLEVAAPEGFEIRGEPRLPFREGEQRAKRFTQHLLALGHRMDAEEGNRVGPSRSPHASHQR